MTAEKIQDQEFDGQKPIVVAVDDNEETLELLRMQLATDYNILTFTSPLLALQKISSKEFDVDIFISDHSMPGMSGITFFKKIIPLYPDSIRILLTAFMDFEIIKRAINDVKIDHYINKPFSPEGVLHDLRSLVEKKQIGYKNKLLLEQMAEQNLQLEEIVQQKTEETASLLRLLCHDVVNPLTIVKNAAYLLSLPYDDNEAKRIQGQGPSEEQKKKLVYKMLKATKIMEQLVGDVREVTAKRSGKLAVQYAEISFSEIIQEVHFIFEDSFKNKNINLVIPQGTTENGTIFYADPSLLKNSIINNIMSNAIKFSHNGGTITMTAKMEKEASLLEIEDQGIGIPSQILERLFHPKLSTNRPGTAGEKGTGFGMHLLDLSIKLLNGSVDVSSKDEKINPDQHGTKFTVRIPRAV